MFRTLNMVYHQMGKYVVHKFKTFTQVQSELENVLYKYYNTLSNHNKYTIVVAYADLVVNVFNYL